MEKYYTPQLEDLHIGYECEIQTNYGYEGFDNGKAEWIPEVMTYKIEGGYSHVLSDTINNADDGCIPIRTKYLTKEQIENEGWKMIKYLGKNPEEGIVFFTKDCEEGHYELEIAMNEQRNSYIMLRTERNQISYFRGNILSINEFRKILKLINIK